MPNLSLPLTHVVLVVCITFLPLSLSLGLNFRSPSHCGSDDNHDVDVCVVCVCCVCVCVVCVVCVCCVCVCVVCVCVCKTRPQMWDPLTPLHNITVYVCTVEHTVKTTKHTTTNQEH